MAGIFLPNNCIERKDINLFKNSKLSILWGGKTLLIILLTFTLITPVTMAEEMPEPELNWIEGTGQKVPLGDNLAELTLSSDFYFLDAEDSATFITEIGGIPSGTEIGTLFPMNEEEGWVVYLEYDEIGHINDDEKEDIDADALLKSYKQGTENANEQLAEEDHLFVDGWDVAPHYDENIHSLSWSLLIHDFNKEELINYNATILTRLGYISAVLVTDPANRDNDRLTLENKILPAIKATEGQRYEDFNASTDKISENGLKALIIGGAGLLAVKKAGLIGLILIFLKKFWFIVIAPIAFLWKRIRGRKREDELVTPNYNEDSSYNNNNNPPAPPL